MNTLGMGIDLVHVPRIRRLLERWGAAGLGRLFHPQELRYAMGTRRPCQHLAGRFAAKEALVKALGGMPDGARWREVRVVRSGSGRPALVLEGAWEARCREMGISGTDVSISHAGEYAAAAVLVVGPGER